MIENAIRTYTYQLKRLQHAFVHSLLVITIPSVRISDLVFHTTYVDELILYMSGRTNRFQTADLLQKLSMAIFIYS